MALFMHDPRFSKRQRYVCTVNTSIAIISVVGCMEIYAFTNLSFRHYSRKGYCDKQYARIAQ